MEQLEKAAQIVMSQGDVVTLEQRREAEEVFLQLRNTKNPFNLVRQILESTKTDYLLFEAATLLRIGIIREWSTLSKEDIIQLRQYILHYIINNQTEAHFVREMLSQVVAIMVKRASVDDDSTEDRSKFLTEVEQLISMSDNNMRMIGCSITNALMQEYAVTVKSTDVGLTWETHFKTKKQFEGTDLRRIFHFVINILSEVLNVEGKISPALSDLLFKLILIAENILTWSFISLHLPKRLMSVFEQDQNPSLRPGLQWKETFLDPSVIQLFFKIYWKVRGDWKMSYHALNCLIQLASLNGAILINRQVRIKYLTQYLECLFSFLNNAQVMEEEALGISNIFRKLLLFFPLSVLWGLPEGMFQQLIDHLTALTCKFAEGAAIEEMVDPEDQFYMEAFEHMLQSWSCVLQENNSTEADHIKRNAIAIFDTYLKCHLGPPNGTRQTAPADEITEAMQSDRLSFRDQLTLIGLCGRQAPEHSVSVLTKLLEEQIKNLRMILSQVAQSGSIMNTSDNSILESLYEDIHWVLLTAGHVMTMDNEGETALIPSELVTLCISSAPKINLEATLNLLANPDKLPAEIPNSCNADPVIRLLSNVLRLCETESQALSANLSHLLSPEVSSSLMWFLRRFTLTYILPNESFYCELSVTLTSSFGCDSEGAVWTLNYLVKTVEKTLRLRHSEPSLVEDTVNLLVTMADSKERGLLLMKSDGVMELVKLLQSEALGSVSSTAQRGLMQGLVMGAAALSDAERKNKFWEHVLDPTINRFRMMVSAETFPKEYHEESIKQKILFHIDNFIGIVQGCLMSTAQCLFTRLISVLDDSVKILDIYHNYPVVVEAVMELFVECGRRMLCFLTPDPPPMLHLARADTNVSARRDLATLWMRCAHSHMEVASKQLYKASVDLVSAYAKHNIGKRNLDAHSSEDEQWRDLQLLIELLTSLLSKDFIDLAPTSHGEDSSEAIAGADVCLFGLNIIMPLISRDHLRLPTLCSQYFKMVTFIAEIYPSKICQLNEELLNNLLMSLELGLTTFGPDISMLSFDFLVVLGSHVHKNCAPDDPIREKLKPFLQLVLNLILSQQVNSDILPSASAAFYTLICCFQLEYQELVGSLLQCQADPDTGQRLAEAFTQLTENILLHADRINRFKFRDNFEKFIANVRGFLLVK